MAKEAKKPSIHYRLSIAKEDHPGMCRQCRCRIVTRSGLIGTVDGRPLCAECLLEEAPRLGWALVLAELVAGAVGGRWPSSATGDELGLFFEFVELARSCGPLVYENRRAESFLERFERGVRG